MYIQGKTVNENPLNFDSQIDPEGEDIPITLQPLWNLETWTDALWRSVIEGPQDNQQCCSLHVTLITEVAMCHMLNIVTCFSESGSV